MSLFARLGNLIKGFFGAFLGSAEAENPDVVYSNAINERVSQYQKLMKAVSGIVYLRNKLEKDLESKTRELQEIHAQIPVAVQSGEEAAALHLIETPGAAVDPRQHFALQVDDLDACVSEIEAKGLPVRRSPDVAGAGRQAFLRDPSGNRIELNEPGT